MCVQSSPCLVDGSPHRSTVFLSLKKRASRKESRSHMMFTTRSSSCSRCCFFFAGEHGVNRGFMLVPLTSSALLPCPPASSPAIFSHCLPVSYFGTRDAVLADVGLLCVACSTALAHVLVACSGVAALEFSKQIRLFFRVHCCGQIVFVLRVSMHAGWPCTAKD